MLYRRLLRSAATYPSRNRKGIYQAIREEFRDHVHTTDPTKLQKQVFLAYQGLQQLRQFDEINMADSPDSSNWTVNLEQNPMPKPADYDERKAREKKEREERERR
jgi:Complex 1 protein (LYR family)